MNESENEQPMGFGNMLKSASMNEESSSNVSGNRMPNVFLDLKDGKRTLRFIPDKNNPGEPLPGEIVYSVWMPVLKDGQMVSRRVFVDDAGRKALNDADRAAGREGDKAYAYGIKPKFFMNVFDRTRVIKLPDGTIVYPNTKNEYWVKVDKGQRQITDIRPEPNNAIMILEGSVSLRSGGRNTGLLNELDDLSKTIYNDDGDKLLPITEVDIELITKTGATWRDTSRQVRPGFNREPFPEMALSLPLYDLKAFTKPWPVEAINALLKGNDYAEVIKQHGLTVMPQLAQPSSAPTATASSDDDEIF